MTTIINHFGTNSGVSIVYSVMVTPGNRSESVAEPRNLDYDSGKDYELRICRVPEIEKKQTVKRWEANIKEWSGLSL